MIFIRLSIKAEVEADKQSKVFKMSLQFLTIFLPGLVCLAGLMVPQVNCQALQTLVHHSEARTALEKLVSEHPEVAQSLLEAGQQHYLWKIFTASIQQNGSVPSQDCLEALESLVPEERNGSIEVPPSLLPLLDAEGKPGAGLLTGNLAWDGAYDECFTFNYTGYCQASKVRSPLIPAKLDLSWILGLCVPKECNRTDVAILINYTSFFKVDEADVKCTTSKESSYSIGAKAMTAVAALFAAMVVLGTLLDSALYYWEQTKIDSMYNVGGSDSVTSSKSHSTKNSETRSLLAYESKPMQAIRVTPWDFITAFSLYKTVPALLATKQASSVITSLNGLRVISMFWVILGHAQLGALSPGIIDNPTAIKTVMSHFTFQAVGNAFFAVDSFFFLSAVLVSYLTLRQMKKRNGRFPFLHFYIHRYLRLTPTYAFVLFFAWALTSNIAYGPGISFSPTVMGDCPNVWWTNFLYINNLYPWKELHECMRWTWYLANDMQFYVISPAILIASYYFMPLAIILVLAVLLSSFVVVGTLVGMYDLQATIFAKMAYNYTGPSTAADYTDLIYIKPWGRIAPYLVGLVQGYMLYKKVHFKFSRIKTALVYLVLWVAAAIALVTVLYGLYFTWHGHTLTKFENVTYITLSRLTWGIGLALIVFSCHNGYGFFVNSLLSMKIWTPLSRMTFNAYLIHPVALFIIYGQFQKSFHYTDITLACFTIALAVVSFAAAAIVCVAVEFPLGTIEMLVFKLIGMKGRNSQRQAGQYHPQQQDDMSEAHIQVQVKEDKDHSYSISSQAKEQ